MSHNPQPRITELHPATTQDRQEGDSRIPFEQAGPVPIANEVPTERKPRLSERAKPGSITASVLEAIEQSNMPAPVSRDARVKHPPAPQRRYREQARRLVDTRALDRNAWLAIRQSGIGSSDAAASVGLNPYKSQLELWMEKTGRQSGSIEPHHDDKLTSPLHWGQVLEPLVAEHYARHTGHRVQRVNAILQHVEHPWMLANLDREIVGNEGVQILECKTAGLYGAKLWKDGVPEYVQLQVMHQLAVTGQQAADVAVLLGGHELQIHRIERDEAMIDQLISLERQFWDFVENDTPPPADGSDSADRALRTLFPQDNGETIDLSHDIDLSQAFVDLQRVRQTLDDAKKQEAKLKHKLQQGMGTATLASFPSGSLSWKQTAPVKRLDTKALQKDHPGLCADYLKAYPGSRRLTVRQ
ncbi:YqaJ viral recombinase family protein [Halomonas vilamensis]|uniref:YqaJ viral recombinase family protein n=1 Tax=Vreelandella vilamensis TaxID=531309 RepID=A0ABU1H8Z1_9GAMM|nr:YqaJ viral recombinase family protein [Halomonas vilamensis]MDR5900321.1 YqaJ viral recombinase family protein [Halomonas vilamensis]